jgi:hypothetical protein
VGAVASRPSSAVTAPTPSSVPAARAAGDASARPATAATTSAAAVRTARGERDLGRGGAPDLAAIPADCAIMAASLALLTYEPSPLFVIV